ncbi:MAG: cupin domain-containing protein [Pseudomonadales bacterium]
MNLTHPALAALLVFATVSSSADAGTPHPAKISRDDQTGAIFARPDTIRSEHDGSTTLDVTTLKSSDGRFASGMYRAGPSRFEVTEPYGVDEFMYFLEGGVTLTSSDGSVQVIEAGEAVTVPREWTGIWETDGYTKIWVIYSEDGSGL